ncbi:unnamed protein product, partial [Linum tenue]
LSFPLSFSLQILFFSKSDLFFSSSFFFQQSNERKVQPPSFIVFLLIEILLLLRYSLLLFFFPHRNGRGKSEFSFFHYVSSLCQVLDLKLQIAQEGKDLDVRERGSMGTSEGGEKEEGRHGLRVIVGSASGQNSVSSLNELTL